MLTLVCEDRFSQKQCRLYDVLSYLHAKREMVIWLCSEMNCCIVTRVLFKAAAGWLLVWRGSSDRWGLLDLRTTESSVPVTTAQLPRDAKSLSTGSWSVENLPASIAGLLSLLTRGGTWSAWGLFLQISFYSCWNSHMKDKIWGKMLPGYNVRIFRL